MQGHNTDTDEDHPLGKMALATVPEDGKKLDVEMAKMRRISKTYTELVLLP